MLLELEEKEKNFQKEPAKNIFKTLIYIAVPITIGVSILPIMNIADVTIVMQRMQDARAKFMAVKTSPKPSKIPV